MVSSLVFIYSSGPRPIIYLLIRTSSRMEKDRGRVEAARTEGMRRVSSEHP